MSDASSRQPGNTWSRSKRAGAALLALLLGIFSLTFALGAPRAAADTSTTARISLSANTPAVSAAGQSVTVSGTITNTGSAPIDEPVAHISVGNRLLDTRTAARHWMSGELDFPLREVAKSGTASLSPGSSTPFAVDIPGKELKFAYGMASLPMTVTVTDGASSAASAIRGMTRSALHLQNQPARAPLALTVVIPLTLPADPDLFGPSGETRAAAWERAVGPDSRVQRTLDAFQGQPVIFAVDPALLEPTAAADDNVPSATASPSPSSSSSSSESSDSSSSSSSSSSPSGTDPSSAGPTTTPDPTSTEAADPTGESTDGSTDNPTSPPSSGSTPPESSPESSPSSSSPPSTPQGKIDAAVDGLADRLTSLDDGQSVWWLPTDDPDVTALQRLGAPGRSLAGRDFARPLPDSVASLGDTRLLWPTGDLKGSAVTAYTKELAKRSKSPAIALLPDRAVDIGQSSTTTHAVAGTSGVLTYDEQLSGIFNKPTTSPGTQTSTLLTQLMALYLQSPGTARSLTLVAPRVGGADPIQLAARVGALREAGWVTLRGGAQATAALRTAPKTTLRKTPRKGDSTPKVPRPAVTAPELAELSRSRTRLAALQSVLVGGDDVIPPREQALDIVGSTRWRGGAAKLAAVADRDASAVTAMMNKLSIRSSTINFFADSGDISVTVSNELNRPVRAVQLELQPRKYLIRVTDPLQQVTIDANSRATAHFHIEAVGGGTVPLDAVLRAPDGTALTDADAPSQLKINVHPTSGWIMWVLGVLAALILVIGLWRAVRRGPRAATASASADAPTPNDAIVDAGQPRQQTDDEGTDDDE